MSAASLAGQKRNVKLKLPPQLVSIIQCEEQTLLENGFLLPSAGGSPHAHASQNNAPMDACPAKRTASDAGLTMPSHMGRDATPEGHTSAAVTEPPTLMNVMLERSAVAVVASSSEEGKSMDAREEATGTADTPPPPGGAGAAAAARHSVTQIVLASQHRFTKELCSYTRAVCMRLGHASCK